MANSFTHAREDELDLGLAFALDKYGMTLDRDTLRILFNETGARSLQIGGRYRFIQARREVLKKKLMERSKEERNRYSAYASAVSKMANRRSQLARAQRKTAAAPTQKPVPHDPRAFLFLDGRQYAFV